MLRIEHLTKTYGNTRAVDDLSLHIAPGEIYGFIGHNGAGKTTTLKSRLRYTFSMTAERFLLTVRIIKDSPVAVKKKIAYIPDNPDIYEFMTGEKYLAFHLRIFSEFPSKDREARIHKYASDFELDGRSRTADIRILARNEAEARHHIRAWIHEPRLVIMDEPFVGLDPKAAHLLKGYDA